MTLVQHEIKAVYTRTSKITDMRGPCPEGYHVPTKDEWQSVYNIWTGLGGGSSDGTNFGIALKLPFAGDRSYSNSSVTNQGSIGYYWSSTPGSGNFSYSLSFYSPGISPSGTDYRSYGFPVRGFKDIPITPTNSWTKLYGTSIESGGIFWSSDDGLISLSSDGTNRITIADKNLGATSTDITSSDSYGYYYQWGNNYGFPNTGSVTTSSSQVNAGSYGPGNFYTSSTFITRTSSPFTWDSSSNLNLWGGVTGVLTEHKIRPEVPATTITLNKSSISLATVGQTEQLTATLTPAGATSTVSWTSSNTSIATVSSNGLVTCVTPGSCTITATTNNGLTATCSVANGWVPGANTVAYYPLVKDVLDYSGNGNNGSGNPNSFTGGVANYSGASTELPYSIIYRDTYTVNLWVNSNQAQSQRGVLNQHTYSSWGFYLSVFKSGGGVWWRTGPGGSDYNDISDSTPLIGWHLITCQVVGGGKKIYVDGVLKASSNYVGSKTTDPLFLGYDHGASGGAWNGKVSKIIVEDKAWTQSEISEYYNQTKSNYGL